MNETDQYLVKVARETYQSVLFIGTKEAATNRAAELNFQYQTDEYYVEKYDPDRFFIL
jgi:hypothetical protein